MKKDIYLNIKDSDALKRFFECITSWSINIEGIDCTSACKVKYLETNNINYPLNFYKQIWSIIVKGYRWFYPFSSCFWTIAFIYSSSSHLGYKI